MDDEMDEIWALYADDGALALDTAEDALSRIAEGPGPGRSDGISALFRAVHTFKGNSRVLGLQVAESRAHLTEDLIGLVRDHGAEWDAEVENIMQLAVDRLRVILEETAASRQDADESFAVDLMDLLRDKIDRISSAASASASASAPEAACAATPEEATGVPEEEAPPVAEKQEPACPPDEVGKVEDPLLDSVPQHEAPPESAPWPVDGLAANSGSDRGNATSPAVADGPLPDRPSSEGPVPNGTFDLQDDVLVSVLALLGRMDQGTGTETWAEVLEHILGIAKAQRYLRLADVAQDLLLGKESHGERQDIRLYEELYAIELSRPGESLPSPRPRDLLCGWCAEHAFALIDDLRVLVENLDAGTEIEASLRQIEPTLRRINAACDYYGLTNAAQLSMSLLDLVLRVSPEIGRTQTGSDETVVQMLQTFISTVELALDASKEGEAPDTRVLDELTEASGQFDFIRSGALTAPQALETLHLPAQFLRVMSPRSVLVAQRAAEAGMVFRVVRTAFQEDTAQAERFFAIMEDGAIRQITSVSVLAAHIVKFDFLLATRLDDKALQARLATVDPTGNAVTVISGEGEGVPVVASADAGADGGVSVEMMEMLGEVSSGLASVIKDLRGASENEGRSRLASALDTSDVDRAQIHRSICTEFDLMVERIEQSLMTMDHLSRRVAALQEEAMVSRLRPADFVLRPLIDHLRIQAKDSDLPVTLAGEIASVPLDRQTLEALEGACELYVQARFELVSMRKCDMSIRLRQRDDRVMLTVEDSLPDAVSAELQARVAGCSTGVGGRVWVTSLADGRSRMTVSVPTRMLAMEGMVITSGGVHYVLPVDALLMVVRAMPDQIVSRAAAGRSRFLNMEDGEVLPIVTLQGGSADKGGLFLIVQAENQRKAMLVDSLVGQEVVRLRPLQGIMARLDRLAGMAVLAGGEVALVLSPLAICGERDDSDQALETA